MVWKPILELTAMRMHRSPYTLEMIKRYFIGKIIEEAEAIHKPMVKLFLEKLEVISELTGLNYLRILFKQFQKQ